MTKQELIKILEKDIKEENAKAERVSNSIKNNEPYCTLFKPVMFMNQTVQDQKFFDYGKYSGRVEALRYIKDLLENEVLEDDK